MPRFTQQFSRVSCKGARCAACGPARPLPLHASAPDKAAALAELQSSQSGLTDRLEGVASAAKAGDAAPAAAKAIPKGHELEEINQGNFYDKIASAGSPVVVVDFYTAWCGPCKLIAPTLAAWNQELAGKATFYKFNCNKANKELGVTLGIKVAPTFHVYKNGELDTVITGAKQDKLRAAIDSLLEA